jgi:hypothetical protein
LDRAAKESPQAAVAPMAKAISMNVRRLIFVIGPFLSQTQNLLRCVSEE